MLLGIGTDNQLHTRATLDSPWELIPGSGTMMGVAALPDRTIVGVGTDNQLHTRATLDSPWELIPGSGTMMAVAAQPDPERHHAGQD
jgi:phage protein U